MNWRENGEHLRKTWRENTLKGIARRYGSLEFLRTIPDFPPGTVCPDCGKQHRIEWTAGPYKEGLSPEFIEALEASTDTDMSPLAAYVSSDKPLSKEEREIISRRLPRRQTMGRPKNSQRRGAASMAWMFYQEWRGLNKRLRAPDHGHCDDMKGYAASWVVEDYFCWGSRGQEITEGNIDDFVASVRELMEKPKHLRDGADRCILAFPAFGWDDSKDRQN